MQVSLKWNVPDSLSGAGGSQGKIGVGTDENYRGWFYRLKYV